MSRKNKFRASLAAASARLGGSHLTREARQRTTAAFAKVMYEEGFTHLVDAKNISGRHLRIYVSARKAQGIGQRTLQNELAHLRGILRSARNHAVADAPELTNVELGIGGGSRLGTNTVMTGPSYDQIVAKAESQGRVGMAAILGLERFLGLRGNEALHAQTDTLRRWLEELSSGGRITVLAGTKGGRPRTVTPGSIFQAMAAVSFAITIAEEQGGFLVVRANGQPAGGLLQARRIYHSWAHRNGIKPHSARDAFAQAQRDFYLEKGYSAREALIAVSHDLGHGDGRGRWVKSVYMR